MALSKKNTLHQFLIPMVDATDFATIESTITASQVNAGTKKFYGVNTGGSAATTSGTLGKDASLVHSGVFRITVQASENNYDHVMVRIYGVTGCAEQIVSWQNRDYDDSDAYSMVAGISDTMSKVYVQTTALGSASNVASVVWTNAPGSDLVSKVSDMRSKLIAMSDVLSQTYEVSSDAHSAATALSGNLIYRRNTVAGGAAATVTLDAGAAATNSLFNDMTIAIVAGTGVGQARPIINYVGATKIATISPNWETTPVAGDSFVVFYARTDHSHIEDIYSALSDVSNIASAIWANATRTLTSAAAATVTASDISDIASAVWAAKYHANSAASSFGSLFSLMATDADQVNSRALLTRSDVSDILSEFLSRVPKAVATNSQVSDVISALYEVASDAHSAATKAASQLTAQSNTLSQIYEVASDAHSAAVATGTGSDIASKVWAVTRTEPTTVVSPTGTVKSALEWLVAVSRNKITQTSAVQSIRNDADAADIASAAVSDDGTTFTRGEFA